MPYVNCIICNIEIMYTGSKEYRKKRLCSNSCIKTYNRRKHWKEKYRAMEILCKGKPKCISCGTQDLRILTLNHLNGRNRSDYYLGGIPVAEVLNGTNSPMDVRCYNCNILYEYERGKRTLPEEFK